MNKVKLGQLVSIQTGKLDANEAVPGGKYPFFTTAKEISCINEYAYDDEVVLVAGNGDLNVKYYKGKFNAYQRTYILTSNSNVRMKYLYYFLDKYIEVLRYQSIGGVIKYIKLNNLSDAQIPMRSTIEQDKIIRILEKLDNEIIIRNKQLSELSNLVKSRFNELFGDLFLNEFKWDYASFNEFAKFDTKMIYDFTNFIDLPHIGIDSIEKNTGKLIGYRTVGEDQISSGKYLFTKKHIIYSKIRPNLNKVALPDFMGVCSADAYPILTIEEKMNRIFLAHVLRSDYFLNFILSFSSRTNLPKVNKSQISKLKCPLPPLSLQNEFADFVAQVDKSQLAIQKSLEELETLKKSLMQEYFG